MENKSSAPTVITDKQNFGKKGKTYPDQRRKYTDSKTGRTVWQMTDTPDRITKGQYATQRMATKDSEWLIYGSDRGNPKKQLNLFKMNLKSGESTQLTESTSDLKPRWAHISPDDKEVYYIDNFNHFKSVNLETLEERSLCIIENCFRPHQLTVSPDNKYISTGILLEDKPERKFLIGDGHLIRSAIVIIDTKTGQRHRLLDGNTPRTHVQYCPIDANLILYCYGGHWWHVQRLWLINADGTNNRPVMLQTHFEGIGHEFWGDGGKTFYAFCNGGRQPQGIWAYDVDTDKEYCVLASACKGHGTANASEDRFVSNEIYVNYVDGLWMSKKGNPQPEHLCQTGWSRGEPYSGYSAHPRFLPDGKRLIFSSTKSGSGEVYMVEL
jgi:oligogalacturonide lyase